ncbi:MAG: hypothetical protein M0P73_04445 [Syntrophobacterales bacterium]|jgi:chemotaxis protein methyltransferase CheR|nr:hypothetical protein [Syntrophobacterales bacterium]
MTQKISDDLLDRLSACLTAHIGVTFPASRRPDLTRGIKAAARKLGYDNAESCIRGLLSASLDRAQIQLLASYLTVGETYFFREKKSLAVFEAHILPELIRSRAGKDRRLRFWCAACATGEEAYTIAMLLRRTIPDLKNWDISILATDINPQFLDKAARGLYDKWSFRETPPEIRQRFFTQRGARFEIHPDLKQMVTFSYLNLAADPAVPRSPYPQGLDLIFCRNVLMYFSPEWAKKVAQRLYRALKNEGWLIVSLTEASHVLFSQFVSVYFPEAIAYKKDPRRAKRIAWQPAAPPCESSGQPAAVRGEFQLPETPAGPEPVTTPPAVSPAIATPDVEREAPIGPTAEQITDLVLQARACADQGRLPEALGWCEQALAADRFNPALHYLRAAILQEQDDVGAAALALKKALYLDQEFVMAHFALGNLALRQGNVRKARKYLENVIALLEACPQDDLLPESAGLTAGRLRAIVQSTIAMRKLDESRARHE